MTPPRIALIGCGAISRLAHLPALVRHADLRTHLVLVDRSLERARELSVEFEVSNVVDDHREVLDEVDGAIIAVPPKHHATIALEFIARGIPVFVEKPLANSSHEAQTLVRTADDANVAIAVNNQRRLIPSLRTAKDLIDSGKLGALRRIEIYEGAPFGWPLSSGGLFGSSAEGKGVLHDIGSHVLDTVCWWLGGTPKVLKYVDDSFGGTEAVARVEFEFQGCQGVIQLSWLSNLSNELLIQGEARSLRGEIKAWDHLTMEGPEEGRSRKIKLDREVPHPQALRNRMIDNFLQVVAGEADPIVSGRDVLPSLEMIDACYGRRSRFEMPWMGLDGVKYAFE